MKPLSNFIMKGGFFGLKGYVIALLELLLFFTVASILRPLGYLTMDSITYYWLCFTVLTGIWEYTYVSRYLSVVDYAKQLEVSGEHVWTQSYSIVMVYPPYLAKLFYAEYGAHADREYMSRVVKDYWSRLVESSHALFCAALSLSALLLYHNYVNCANIVIAAGMGAQFMNSVLYMGQYFIQCNNANSVNYDTPAFPVGPYMLNRWFMWVNLFWLLFPAYITTALAVQAL